MAEPAVLSLFVFLSSLFGGGLPLGVPPLPEDPTLAAVAPEKCPFYLSRPAWRRRGPRAAIRPAAPGRTGSPPDDGRNRAGHQGEPGPRDEEVRAPERPSADEILGLVKLALTRPAAFYVTDLQIETMWPFIGSLYRAGLVVNVGDDLEKTKAAVAQPRYAVAGRGGRYGHY